MIQILLTSHLHHIQVHDRFTVLLTKSGKVWSCGNNSSSYHKCGYNQIVDDDGLHPIDIVDDIFQDISIGHAHCLSLSKQGELYVFGKNIVKHVLVMKIQVIQSLYIRILKRMKLE